MMVVVQDDMKTNSGPGGDNFNMAFSAVLDRATCFGECVQEIVTERHPMKPLDQMPESTAWRLHLASTGSYIASIQCLRDRRSSLGGYILMRGLLEAWSHLDFIADDAQGGSSALRAIRYEAGLIHEWEGTAHDVPGAPPMNRSR